MGRNKVIYALSSAAVVVSSAFETGGTWAGAIENLRAGWVPLLVRDGPGVPDGNRELIKRGGRPVRSEDLESSLETMLHTSTSAQPASLVRESSAYEDASESRNPDLFQSLWPRLAAFLATARTEAEVAQAFDVEPAQTKAWLQRAVDEGLVRKLSKPLRFERIDAPRDSQASLFEP
jgi:predicted Rossmann fold nucleotide-binding protein DprA/Smf involved in DNA uptake